MKKKINKFFEEVIWDNIKYLFDKIETLYYNIKYGIMNLFIWFVPVWKNRDWDQYFLFRIMEFKLKRMEHLIRTCGHHVDSEKDAHKIKICQLLLKRLADDDYLENATINHDKKWGGYVRSDDKTDFSAMFRREKATTEEEHNQECKEFMRFGKHADNMTQQDLDLLFKIMRRNILSWWD